MKTRKEIELEQQIYALREMNKEKQNVIDRLFEQIKSMKPDYDTKAKWYSPGEGLGE